MCGCKNVGPVDRALRLVVGIILIALAIGMLGVAEGSVGGIIAVAAGAVLLLTGALGFCPAYLPLKLSTCKVRS
ncbi:MAG: DUF2892 domain-containing protein [Phycisphaeraceae bacterium]|nr:DUF2892 domain-containing protein [Phycisphaeraceae bacterium]